MRARLAPLVAAGVYECARCGKLIEAGEPWDLGHDDLDPTQYSGPEHRRCNRSTLSHAKERAEPRRYSREW